MSQTDADVGIYGHTHRSILRMTNDGRYIFNPGSVGMPVSDRLEISGKASYGILTVDQRSVLSWDQRNVPYDLKRNCKLPENGKFHIMPCTKNYYELVNLLSIRIKSVLKIKSKTI